MMVKSFFDVSSFFFRLVGEGILEVGTDYFYPISDDMVNEEIKDITEQI